MFLLQDGDILQCITDLDRTAVVAAWKAAYRRCGTDCPVVTEKSCGSGKTTPSHFVRLKDFVPKLEAALRKRVCKQGTGIDHVAEILRRADIDADPTTGTIGKTWCLRERPLDGEGTAPHEEGTLIPLAAPKNGIFTPTASGVDVKLGEGVGSIASLDGTLLVRAHGHVRRSVPRAVVRGDVVCELHTGMPLESLTPMGAKELTRSESRLLDGATRNATREVTCGTVRPHTTHMPCACCCGQCH